MLCRNYGEANMQYNTHNLPSVLVVHNKYQFAGGEDTVVDAEVDLLRSLGWNIETLIYNNADVDKMRKIKRRPDQIVYNRGTYKEIRARIQRNNIQIIHCHNLFHLLSTSVYDAAKAEGIPVVQTVHNYRMACLNGLHLRNGQICERCRPGHHLEGITQGCYRGSQAQSMVLGLTQTVNHWRGAWQQPSLYIAPGRFLRDKLIGWGIAEEKVVVKPHFIPHDPGPPSGAGQHALFIGRLSEEKGVDLLLDIWTTERPPLLIVGDGPLRAHLERRVEEEGKSNVRLLGHQDRDSVNALLREARVLLMPSVWYETFGLVLIEAFSHGVPVVATRLGAMADVVRDGVTGLLFETNDRADLAKKLDALEADPARLREMASAARLEYEMHYSRRANAEQLRSIYARAIEQETTVRRTILTQADSRNPA